MSVIDPQEHQRSPRMSVRPPRPLASGVGTTDPDVVIEHIAPRLFDSTELDVLERYFGDIVARALGR